ncbi:MAG: haloacid dehalogenase [Chthonomonadales bacterium]|nr:haloacid dehalogenase [Chthonomonadales bacterium]
MEPIAARIRAGLEAKNSARELALRQCREIIQASARAIRSVHRGDFSEADRWIARAREIVAQLRLMLPDFPDIYYAGYVNDAQKEYVEAEAVRALVLGRTVPDPEQLGVEPAAYLNGLAEAGSECRRYVLDRLRDGDIAVGERLMEAMDDIYFELMTFDFPDAITGGLRRTVDAFRAVLERTRGDVTLTHQQKALYDALAQAGAGGASDDG